MSRTRFHLYRYRTTTLCKKFSDILLDKQTMVLSGHRLIIIYYIVNTWLNIAMVDNLQQKRSKLIMNTYMTSIRQIKRILCDIIHQCKHTSTQRSERKLLFNRLLPLSNIIYERGLNLSYKRNIFHIAYNEKAVFFKYTRINSDIYA